jgi:mannose-6-phosphate isomerase-like protein (cupin superfamily)
MKIIRSDDRPYVPAGHENPISPGVWKKVLLQKADLQPGQVQMINWARLPAGNHFAPHYHEDMQEVFIMLGGAVEIQVGEERAQLRPGDTILIDAREIHQMWNPGADAAEYIALGIAGGQDGKTIVVK